MAVRRARAGRVDDETVRELLFRTCVALVIIALFGVQMADSARWRHEIARADVGTGSAGRNWTVCADARPAVDPGAGEALLRRLRVPELWESGVTGKGVTAAVIDTGVDPSRFPAGTVVGWVDLTAEGVVLTGGPYPVQGDKVTAEGMTLDVRAVPSRSGNVRVGYWLPSKLPDLSVLKRHWDGGPVAVVVTDRRSSGTYDTVYLDADGDGYLSPSEELPRYDQAMATARVSRKAQQAGPLTMVLCDIRANGQVVVLGFDGHGHGTSVASVLAGAARGYSGLCPGVGIVAIKAVDSTGSSTWELVSRALETAVAYGADVIVLGMAPREGYDGSTVRKTLETVSKRSLVVMAGGNTGPGLSSLPSYAGARGTLIVGGFLPVESQRLVGASLARDVFWPWSACGPTQSGATADLVAPAVVPALSPTWQDPQGRLQAFEGTSAAAAVVAGLSSLLLQEAVKLRLKDVPNAVRRALVESAEPAQGLTAVEQGAGIVSGWLGLQALRTLSERSTATAVFKWDGGYQEGAFWERSRTPGTVPFRLENLSPRPLLLNMEFPRWVELESDRMDLPAIGEQSSVLRIRAGPLPGLYSGFIVGDDPTVGGTELRVPITVLRPREFPSGGSLEIDVPLQPGRIRREYFRVPASAETLSVALSAAAGSKGQTGTRACLRVYDPQGRCMYESPWVGPGTQSLSVSCVLNLPVPGTWEIVVVGDPLSQTSGFDARSFRLTASIGGVVCERVATSSVAAPDGNRSYFASLSWRNSGPIFSPTVFLSDSDRSHFERKRVWVSSSASTVRTLPRVTEKTQFLYVAIQHQAPGYPSAALPALYLYRYDDQGRRWVEVATARSTSRGVESVLMIGPPPGEYVAYIEIPKSAGSDGAYVEWVSALGESPEGWHVTCGNGTSNGGWWAWNEERRFEIITANRAVSPPASLMLSIWDAAEAKLKGMVSLKIHPVTDEPFVSVLEGHGAAGLRFLTIKAWGRSTGKTVDACVRLGDTWHQLFRGEATVLVPESQAGEISEISVAGQLFVRTAR